MDNFLECINTRKPTNSTAEMGHLSCALVHLGEIAYRTKSVLEFDPVSEQVTNNSEANKLLAKEYRTPYGPPSL